MSCADPVNVWVTCCLETPSHPWKYHQLGEAGFSQSFSPIQQLLLYTGVPAWLCLSSSLLCDISVHPTEGLELLAASGAGREAQHSSWCPSALVGSVRALGMMALTSAKL